MKKGIGLIAAGALLSYVLFNTKGGEKAQSKMKGWVIKAKGDVLDKLEDIKDLNEESYYTLVDSVLAKYSKLKKVETKEVEGLVKEFKKHWKVIKKNISAELAPVSKKK